MKRPLAYITAAWNGEPDIDTALAVQYCRITYEAGFSPICPLCKLWPPFYLLPVESIPPAAVIRIFLP